jgi:hypothetical protein
VERVHYLQIQVVQVDQVVAKVVAVDQLVAMAQEVLVFNQASQEHLVHLDTEIQVAERSQLHHHIQVLVVVVRVV